MTQKTYTEASRHWGVWKKKGHKKRFPLANNQFANNWKKKTKKLSSINGSLLWLKTLLACCLTCGSYWMQQSTGPTTDIKAPLMDESDYQSSHCYPISPSDKYFKSFCETTTLCTLPFTHSSIYNLSLPYWQTNSWTVV